MCSCARILCCSWRTIGTPGPRIVTLPPLFSGVWCPRGPFGEASSRVGRRQLSHFSHRSAFTVPSPTLAGPPSASCLRFWLSRAFSPVFVSLPLVFLVFVVFGDVVWGGWGVVFRWLGCLWGFCFESGGARLLETSRSGLYEWLGCSERMGCVWLGWECGCFGVVVVVGGAGRLWGCGSGRGRGRSCGGLGLVEMVPARTRAGGGAVR